VRKATSFSGAHAYERERPAMKLWIVIASLFVIAGTLAASPGAELRSSATTCHSSIYVGRCYYGRLTGSYTLQERRDYDNVNFHQGGNGPCVLETGHWSATDYVTYTSAARGRRVARFSAANPTGYPLDADTSFRTLGYVWLTVTHTRVTNGYITTDLGPPAAHCTGVRTEVVNANCSRTKTGLVRATFNTISGARQGTAHFLLDAATDRLAAPCTGSSHAGGQSAPFPYVRTFKRPKFTIQTAIRGANLTQPEVFLGHRVGFLDERTVLQWTFCETGKVRAAACRARAVRSLPRTCETIEGSVQTIQKDTAGRARGYVLEDGVIVVFPPESSGQLAAIVTGTKIQVGGCLEGKSFAAHTVKAGAKTYIVDPPHKQ
jgi:hypothetical protein